MHPIEQVLSSLVNMRTLKGKKTMENAFNNFFKNLRKLKRYKSEKRGAISFLKVHFPETSLL